MSGFVKLTPNARRASRNAAEVLANMGFDPLEQMVHLAVELGDELTRQKDIRSGALVEINPNTLKPRAYNSEAHGKLHDQLLTVNDKLLRYAYGRVPEGEPTVVPKKPELRIILTDGQEYKRES